MFNLFKKKEVVSENKLDFSKIINAEDLNKFHQKTWEDSINELEEKVKIRRVKLVEGLTKDIIEAAKSGRYELRKGTNRYSIDNVYKYYELPKGNKGNGKEWINSLVDSFKENGYGIKISIKESTIIRTHVEFYISWR